MYSQIATIKSDILNIKGKLKIMRDNILDVTLFFIKTFIMVMKLHYNKLTFPMLLMICDNSS